MNSMNEPVTFFSVCMCAGFYLPKLLWALLRSMEAKEAISIVELTLL